MATEVKKMRSKPGKLGIAGIKSVLNKKAGMTVAADLSDTNPSDVQDWISTGCTWLDGVIARGKMGGIPVGRITEMCGLEGSGKSYIAAQVAANANRSGLGVIYFDSEAALDSNFLKKVGIDPNNFLRVTPTSVENVFETIETILTEGNEQVVFIWDSLANTPTELDVAGTYNPSESIGVKARILSKAMAKLTVPLSETNSTFLVLNQLKTNITRDMADAMINPYISPGGKSMHYSSSLRIFLTGRKGKASYIYDDNGFKIGSETKAKIKKSRFGTEGREAFFKIMWGDEVFIEDDASIFEAIKGKSDKMTSAGAWYSLTHSDGTKEKFQSKQWNEKMKEEKFRISVMEIFNEEVVRKFANREGTAKDFYGEDEKDVE